MADYPVLDGAGATVVAEPIDAAYPFTAAHDYEADYPVLDGAGATVISGPGTPLGPETAVNGTFVNEDGWTVPGGRTVVGRKATCTSGNASLTNEGAECETGETYTVTLQIEDYVSGNLALAVGANYAGQHVFNAPGNGTFTADLVAGSDTGRGVEFYGGAFRGALKNVSVRKKL